MRGAERLPPYQKEGAYILARNGPEYHIAKIISEGETSNPGSVGNASTKCLRYYKSHEYSIAEKEPSRDEVCRACLTKKRLGG
ncbi:hypothetical protein [Nitrososphaera sp.]|uniref:hypothetical protein n=1 Tax=Nitrososphaera sp. TaxID=1971748 RepID=UPI00307E83D4